MKIYSLDWSWYGDSVSFLFSTEEDKTESQFFCDCSLAFQKAGLKILEVGKNPDMIDWTLHAKDEMLSLGYKIYSPISLYVTGECLMIAGKPEIDVDITPRTGGSVEQFLGEENCKKIKELMIKCDIMRENQLREYYENYKRNEETKEIINEN